MLLATQIVASSWFTA